MARSRSGVDWVVPTTLITSFLAGIALAFGHHYFYSSLDEYPVQDARWSQDTNNSIGTAFTFLVRAAFVVAISTAYWQIFWRRLHQPIPLSTIDGLASQTQAIYQMLNFNSIKASPLLFGSALLTWLVPLAVVFPPAALKVIPKGMPWNEMQQFPVPNYTNPNNFVVSSFTPGGITKRNGMGQMVRPSGGLWLGPKGQLRRSLTVAAYQGELPTFTAPGSNSSYNLEFQGPLIECNRMEDEGLLWPNLTEAGVQCINGSQSCTGAWDSSLPSTLFLSWVANETTIVPVTNESIVDAPQPPVLGTNPERPQALYIAYRANTSAASLDSGDAAIINCSLFNATYSTSFIFRETRQEVIVRGVRKENSIVVAPPPPRDRSSTLAFPDAFAAEATEVQSYLAYMQVVGELLVGSLHVEGSTFRTTHTHVLETELAFTEELFPFYRNFTNDHRPRKLRPLKDALEDLFLNMTLSILNTPSLLGPQVAETQVSFSRTRNQYQYNQKRLWWAYGAATAAAFIAVLCGVSSLISTGSSYSNKFSTVIRFSRDESLDVFIKQRDRFGQDPLPEYIGQASLNVNEAETDSESDGPSKEARPEDKASYVQVSLLRDSAN